MEKNTSTTNKALNSYIKSNDTRVSKLETKITSTNSTMKSLADRVSKFEELAKSSSIDLELQKQTQLKNNIVIDLDTEIIVSNQFQNFYYDIWQLHAFLKVLEKHVLIL